MGGNSYILNKMSIEEPEEIEDDVLKELNRRLDEEEKKLFIVWVLDKRLKTGVGEAKRKPREAKFKGKDGKERRVAKKEPKIEYQCPRCGSTDLGSYSEEEPKLFKIRGTLYSDMLYCRNCGAKRLGVLKE